MTRSVLDGIKGIGEKEKPYIGKISRAYRIKIRMLEDFIRIKGLSYKDALNVYNSLNRY